MGRAMLAGHKVLSEMAVYHFLSAHEKRVKVGVDQPHGQVVNALVKGERGAAADTGAGTPRNT